MNRPSPFPADRDGEVSAWRNLLWDSARMRQAGRPDLAIRFQEAARQVEQSLRAPPAWRANAGALAARALNGTA